MKIKESPSIILAFHGMLGRKKQTSLLLLLLTLVFDGGGDLLRQLCTGIAGHPLRTIRRVAVPAFV